jgi:superfamily I DNA and/or RNA helicase
MQYRMHPLLAAFPSQQAYGGLLRTAVRADERPVPDGFPWPVADKPVAFVAVGAPGEALEAEASGGSRYNVREAKKVAEIVQMLIHHNG